MASALGSFRAWGPAVHVDPYALSAKRDPLDLKAEPLLASVDAGQGDPTAGRDHAVPRKPLGPSEGPDREPGAARNPRRLGDLAVGDHPTPGHARDHGPQAAE